MIIIMSSSLFAQLRVLPGHRRRFDSGAFLFRQDDPVESLYLIETGAVGLLRHQPDGFVLTLHRAGTGSVLAEASLYAERYHCDAEAAQATGTFAIRKPAILSAFARDPALAAAWAAHLAQEVQAARLRAEILALRTVAARLDAWLAAHRGRLPPRGGRRSVAAEIGITPEALYRELGRRRRTAAPAAPTNPISTA